MGEALGLSFDLLPGATGDAPAGQLQELLSLAVMLESRIGVVKAAAIGLDNQAGVAPEEVRLDPPTTDVEGNVDLGRRKLSLAAHAKKDALQFATGPLRFRMKFVEEEAKPRNPTATTAAAEQSAQAR